MPRKKTSPTVAPIASTVMETAAAPAEEAKAIAGAEEPGEPKEWTGKSYRPLFTCPAKGFEMAEDRRFKQMVFTFQANPGPEVTEKLKAAGYRYRGAEKAWTIAATAVTREEAVRLAREFKGEQLGAER